MTLTKLLPFQRHSVQFALSNLKGAIDKVDQAMERRKQLEVQEKLETMFEQNQKMFTLMNEGGPGRGGGVHTSYTGHSPGAPVDPSATHPQSKASPISNVQEHQASEQNSQEQQQQLSGIFQDGDNSDDSGDSSEDSVDPFAMDDSDDDGEEEVTAHVEVSGEMELNKKGEPLTVLEQLQKIGVKDLEGVHDLEKLLDSNNGADKSDDDSDSENGDQEEKNKLKREEKNKLKVKAPLPP
jgi:hypothetical protein